MRAKKTITRVEDLAAEVEFPSTYDHPFAQMKSLLRHVLRENLPDEYRKLRYHGDESDPEKRQFLVETRFFVEIMPGQWAELETSFPLDPRRELSPQITSIRDKIHAIKLAYSEIHVLDDLDEDEKVERWRDKRAQRFERGLSLYTTGIDSGKSG